MDTNKILSLKKCNSQWISEKIKESTENISANIDLAFKDVPTAIEIGNELLRLAELKTAQLRMETPSYKAYDATGKNIGYDVFLLEIED